MLLKRAMHSAHQFSNIIGNSEPMRQVFELVETIAPTGSTVLITGESGTGKELVARAIHGRSPRQRSAVCRGELRRADRDAPRFGAVRPHARRVHRRRRQPEGPHRSRREGHDLPRRDRRDEPDAAGASCCACCRSGGSGASAGTDEVEADIRIIAATNRDLAKMVERGPVPRGPLLPHQRHSRAAAAAARARRGHPDAGRALRRPVRRADGEAGARHFRGRA